MHTTPAPAACGPTIRLNWTGPDGPSSSDLHPLIAAPARHAARDAFARLTTPAVDGARSEYDA